MIALDTSVLIASIASPQPLLPQLKAVLDRGELLIISTAVLYEWLRGPRLPYELAAQEVLFPANLAHPFNAEDARIAARLYRVVSKPRGREIDLAIAACAIRKECPLWTLNYRDFADIPGLQLANPK